MLLQKDDQTFASVESEAGVVNRKYEIAPLLADFNGDGRPDIVHVNIAGRSQAFLSRPGSGSSLKVQLRNQARSIGAKVTVGLSDGSEQSKWFIRGEGLVSDSSPILIFGLGDAQATAVKVRYLDGEVRERSGPFVGGTLAFGADEL